MVATVTTYEVRAERDDRGWILTVPSVPGAVSQVRRLADAPEWITESIAFITGDDEASIDVQVTPFIGGIEREATQAREATRAALHAQEAAARLARKAARDLKGAGLSGADTAVVLGVSPQRVSQLIKEG